MLKYTHPNYLIGSAADLTPRMLFDVNIGAKAAIFDFDNTLADFGATELPQDSVEMLSRLGRAGILCFAATNVYDEEAEARQHMLRRTRDPRTNRPLIVETVIPSTVTPYRANPHDYKKPAPDMIKYILRGHRLAPEHVFMVGDQMRSDMTCVEDLGLVRVLTDKRGTHDHSIVKFSRPIESTIRHLGHYGFFPQDLTSVEDWAALSFAERRTIDRERRENVALAA